VTQARGTMRQRVLVEKVVLPTCRLLLIGGFLAAGLGLTGAAWGTTLACAVSLAVAVYLAAGVIRRAWGRARPRWGELKPVLLYAIPLVLSALALFGRRRGIMLALGVSGTAGDVGLYAAAERAALAGAMGLNAIGTIFSPIAADLYNRKRHDELHAILKTSAAWIAMVVLPGTAFLAVFAPEVMSAFGKGFPEGHVALAILAVAQMINCALGSVDFLFVMAGKQWLAIIDLTFFALASMGLTFHLAPSMGVTGAALAGAIGFLGPRMMRATQVAVLLRMNPFGVGQLRVAGCVIPPALLALIWRHHLAAVLPAHALWWLIMPTYFALYAVLLRLVAREQLSGLVRVLRQRRGRAAATAEEQMAEEELPSTPTAPSAEDGGLD